MRALLVTALAATGCYEPNVSRCAIRCEPGQTCPQGLACNADDGYCHAEDDPEVCAPRTFELAIDRGGVGGGRFLGRDGLDCAEPHCVVQAQEGPYTLTVVPDRDARVTAWAIDGAPAATCGSDARCTFDLVADTAVGVTLGAGRSLTVNVVGRGSARVASLDGAVGCELGSSPCVTGYDVGASVTLEAAPAAFFVGWSGACRGTDPVCVVSLAESAQVTARFDVVRVQLVPVPTGAGALAIASSRGTVQCPPSCDVDLPPSGETVTLTALPASAFALDHWFNNPCEKGALLNPCGPIRVDADTAMIALFAELPFVDVAPPLGQGAVQIEGTLDGQPVATTCDDACRQHLDPDTFVRLTFIDTGFALAAWNSCPQPLFELDPVCPFTIAKGQQVFVAPTLQ